MISEEQFKGLTPKDRGYAVYMFGARDDEPNVPDERNPYPANSEQAAQWDEGQRIAVLVAQDSA